MSRLVNVYLHKQRSANELKDDCRAQGVMVDDDDLKTIGRLTYEVKLTIDLDSATIVAVNEKNLNL